MSTAAARVSASTPISLARSRRVWSTTVWNVARGAAVVGQLGEQHAQQAGVRERGDGQPGADERGQPRHRCTSTPTSTATSTSAAGDQADLAFEVPARPWRRTGRPSASQASDAAGRGAAGWAGRPRRALCSAWAARLPDRQISTTVSSRWCAQLVAVFAEQVERHVVGAGDVPGVELARGAHVDQSRCRRPSSSSSRNAVTSMVVGVFTRSPARAR